MGPPLFLPCNGIRPTVSESAWVAEGCVIAGDVFLGEEVSVWFGAIIRGDVNRIRIGSRTNVQDGCVLHVSGDAPLEIESGVTIGHGAILHGCVVRAGALIGIGARVLDHAEIGAESLIGAGSLVVPGTRIPPGVLALGSPARVTRPLSAEERGRNRESAARYVDHARAYRSR